MALDSSHTYGLQVNVFPGQALLPELQGSMEGLKILRGLWATQEPVKGRVDEQCAEEGPMRVVGLRQEKPLRWGQG